MSVSQEILDQIAMSPSEYDQIVKRLGREPNDVELGMLGSLWSEHCSYKHSKPLLRLLPSTGDRVLVRAGEENAGAIDIGDGLCIVMKIESHNHPSAVEPYQGAATGVGGIVRDIFAMGARPIALFNSLRFGPLEQHRNRYLFGGVVGGIAGYGNCLGIPNVGGEVFFSQSYSGNPLVNAMCVGIVEEDRLIRARAEGEGNLVVLLGADTGRDGIHGASGLASRAFEGERELRPTVQVGNPFLEKVLIEACLELVKKGLLMGLADLGAAGLTSAAVESAARAGSGIDIDVAKVPRRETGMTPYEVMLSESQERMLLFIRPENEAQVKEVTDRWDLRADRIGLVTDTGMARIFDSGNIVAELPVGLLTSPPEYQPRAKRPPQLERLQELNMEDISPPGTTPSEVLLRLLASPNIASKRAVYRQYDHQVQTNTVAPPGADAAVLRIKGTKKGIALTTDGNGRYCYLDPYTGGAIAVAEAARNVVCTGARPIAVTDCLNFGDPDRPEVYFQLEECIKGMAKACHILNTPVVSGNVSLYNETKGQPIYPTPVIGMLGLLEDVNRHCTPRFKNDGDIVFVLGRRAEPRGLGGSEYLEVIHRVVKGRPFLDLNLEKRVQVLCLGLIEKGLAKSAHDCSLGGLGVALAVCCAKGAVGLKGKVETDLPWDAALFGETQSRIVISVSPEYRDEAVELATQAGVATAQIGVVGGDRLLLEGLIDVSIEQIASAWENGLTEALK